MRWLLFIAVLACLACSHSVENIVLTTVFDGATRKDVYLDKCIAPIVGALGSKSIPTLSSCCGHGKGWGYILLTNRVLIVTPETAAENARKLYDVYFENMAAYYGDPSWDEIMMRQIKTNTARPLR